jgi:hypothetical protein
MEKAALVGAACCSGATWILTPRLASPDQASGPDWAGLLWIAVSAPTRVGAIIQLSCPHDLDIIRAILRLVWLVPLRRLFLQVDFLHGFEIDGTHI